MNPLGWSVENTWISYWEAQNNQFLFLLLALNWMACMPYCHIFPLKNDSNEPPQQSYLKVVQLLSQTSKDQEPEIKIWKRPCTHAQPLLFSRNPWCFLVLWFNNIPATLPFLWIHFDKCLKFFAMTLVVLY